MIGIDCLGLASPNWDIQSTINWWPQGYAIGVFDGPEAFGNVIPNLRRLFVTGKVSAVRIHAWWDDNHVIAPLNILQNRLPRYESLAKEFPNIKFAVSHSCEYAEPNIAAVKKRVDLVVKLCPSCEVIQAPGKLKTGHTSPVVPSFMLESHGKDAKAPLGIVSGDGFDSFQTDMESWNNRNASSFIRFAWGARCNGTESGPRIPRPKRTAFPKPQYLEGLSRILGPIGTPPSPTFSGQIIPVAKPLLWKAAAEDMPSNQPRDNKPLIMLKSHTQSVDIVTFQGESFGKLVYFDTYPGGLYRYYSGLPGGIFMYGWEIADKAEQISGSAFVWVRQGSSYFGPVHPAFRRGFYQ